MSTPSRILVAALAAALAAPIPARALEILDQSFVVASPPGGLLGPGDTNIGSIASLAQTFTVGVAGTLSRVDVAISQAAPGGVLRIVPVEGGVPVADDARALATLAFPTLFTDATRLLAFDLRPFAIAVAPGDVLAFQLSPGQDGGLGVRASFPGVPGHPDYEPGGAFLAIDGGDFAPHDPFNLGWAADINFRTFVEVAAVPEPPALASAGLGLLGLAGLARIRREGRAG